MTANAPPYVEKAWAFLGVRMPGEAQGIKTSLSMSCPKATPRANQSFKEPDDHDAPHRQPFRQGRRFLQEERSLWGEKKA
jgi:hypothetical protein